MGNSCSRSAALPHHQPAYHARAPDSQSMAPSPPHSVVQPSRSQMINIGEGTTPSLLLLNGRPRRHTMPASAAPVVMPSAYVVRPPLRVGENGSSLSDTASLEEEEFSEAQLVRRHHNGDDASREPSSVSSTPQQQQQQQQHQRFSQCCLTPPPPPHSSSHHDGGGSLFRRHHFSSVIEPHSQRYYATPPPNLPPQGSSGSRSRAASCITPTSQKPIFSHPTSSVTNSLPISLEAVSPAFMPTPPRGLSSHGPSIPMMETLMLPPPSQGGVTGGCDSHPATLLDANWSLTQIPVVSESVVGSSSLSTVAFVAQNDHLGHDVAAHEEEAAQQESQQQRERGELSLAVAFGDGVTVAALGCSDRSPSRRGNVTFQNHVRVLESSDDDEDCFVSPNPALPTVVAVSEFPVISQRTRSLSSNQSAMPDASPILKGIASSSQMSNTSSLEALGSLASTQSESFYAANHRVNSNVSCSGITISEMSSGMGMESDRGSFSLHHSSPNPILSSCGRLHERIIPLIHEDIPYNTLKAKKKEAALASSKTK